MRSRKMASIEVVVAVVAAASCAVGYTDDATRDIAKAVMSSLGAVA